MNLKADQHQKKPEDALIRMLNQIADNLAPGKSPDVAAQAVADHVNRFWARSMKQAIVALSKSDHRLNSLARQTIPLLTLPERKDGEL